MTLRRNLDGTLGGIFVDGIALDGNYPSGRWLKPRCLGDRLLGRRMLRRARHAPLASVLSRGSAVLVLGMAFAAAAAAQATGPATSAGPGRITCASAAACELGVGVPASMTYRIDTTALLAADKDRLAKQCTAKAPPCVATVQGTEQDDPMKLKATSIKFYN